jgi:hypothetical protein
MHSVTVRLNGQEHVITELRSRANAAWRKKLEVPFQDLAKTLEQAPSVELTDSQALAHLVRTVGMTLLDSMETVQNLLVEYAPDLRADVDEAYDSEIVEAFTAVLGLAYPFGSVLSRLQGFGWGAPPTRPS